MKFNQSVNHTQHTQLVDQTVAADSCNDACYHLYKSVGAIQLEPEGVEFKNPTHLIASPRVSGAGDVRDVLDKQVAGLLTIADYK